MREQGKPERMMGNLISFTDSENFGKVTSTIFVNGFRNIRDIGDLSRCETFMFGFDPAKEYNKELIKFHGWLSMNSQKAAVIILDKYHSHAIIIPALYDDEASLKAVGFRSGFICKVYDNKNPNKKTVVPDEPFYDPSSMYGSSSAPTSSSPTSSSSHSSTLARPPSIDYTSTYSSSGYSYLNPTPTPAPFANPLPPVSAPVIAPVVSASSNITAEDHYNKLKRSKETRHQSQLFHMRNLNNFTKAELIEEAIQYIASQPPPSSSSSNPIQKSHLSSRRGCSVLELACGKGGDIMKWMKNGYTEITRYIGIDIAENSIKEFVERLTKRSDNLSERVIIEKLIVGNLNQDSLISSSLLTHTWLQHGFRSEWKEMIPLQSTDAFDIISCQFAMHYMFGSAKSVKHFFTEISRHLNESGLYIATTIDYRILIHYIMKAKYGPMESAMKNTTHQVISTSPQETTMSTSIPTNYDTAPGFKSKEILKDSVKYLVLQFYNEFQKLLLQIELKQETVDRLLGQGSNPNGSDDDWFGVEYNFILHDSDDEAAVNSPEFIVPIFTTHFQEILYSEKLEIMKIQNFHDFILDKFDHDNSRDRMNKMEVFNVNGTISEAEWLIARLYTVLILKKVPNIAEKPKAASVAPSLVPPDSNPVLRVQEPQNPPRIQPSSPKYAPRRIGALIDAKDPIVLNHQATYATLLTTAESSRAMKKRPHEAIENQEERREDDDKMEEDSEEEEEDFEFLEKVRERAIELVGGVEQWEALPDDEIERFIMKAKALLKSSPMLNGKGPWKIYPPRSPDHPPPQLRGKMQTTSEEENEDDSSLAQMQIIRARAVELAGGEEAWENLDDDCCDDFIEVARKQLEQGRKSN